ncbi:hypothetical protein E2562_038241 [Oryza meyeriana var. granulata]|uniref:Uncharacterized protein n=1 Tax=Oryza meyeriana var. granulata TaxID=110450 RepID=A0A6G1FGD0_9ORYZ|nr:hypothetical protein E2562_038241 [Oryza meyeriana var. granulata]
MVGTHQFGQTVRWIDVTMDTPGGYDEHLCKMMSYLRYLVALAYRARKFEFGDCDKWEASV